MNLPNCYFDTNCPCYNPCQYSIIKAIEKNSYPSNKWTQKDYLDFPKNNIFYPFSEKEKNALNKIKDIT